MGLSIWFTIAFMTLLAEEKGISADENLNLNDYLQQQ
jgi:hypothetical protein